MATKQSTQAARAASVNDITSDRTYPLRLALSNLEEICDQNERIYAVASAGIAYCGEDQITEPRLFQVIQKMVESTEATTEIRKALEQLMRHFADAGKAVRP